MTTGNPCLILEWSDAANWPDLCDSTPRRLGTAPLRIPMGGMPTVLQPDRETAEREAKRLAAEHPEKTFAVFECHVVARAVDVPSHVTLSGRVWQTRKVPTLLEVDDSEIPF